MVIVNETIKNVLHRIFLIGIAYNGRIPQLYTQAMSELDNLDFSVLSTNASAVNNAPFAWVRNRMLVLRVGKLMFSYTKQNINGETLVIVDEVAENGIIVTEGTHYKILSLMERMDNLYKWRSVAS